MVTILRSSRRMVGIRLIIWRIQVQVTKPSYVRYMVATYGSRFGALDIRVLPRS